MNKKILYTALVLLGVCGFLLHYRIHPFLVPDPANAGQLIYKTTGVIANIFPFLDVVLVSLLFLSRKTAVYGYVLNGMIVIFGTIFMAHFSISYMLAKAIPMQAMFAQSLLPDIGIAWADFFVGKALYDEYMRG